MRHSDRALMWSFWRCSQPFLSMAILVFCAAVAIALKWPEVISHPGLYCFCAMGWISLLCSASLITNHHLSLPMSNRRLAFLLGLFTCLLTGTSCVVTLSILNFMGGTWHLVEATLITITATMMCVGFANWWSSWVPESEFKTIEFLASFSILAVPMIASLSDRPTEHPVEWLHSYRGPVFFVVASLGGLLLGIGIARRRRGACTIQKWLNWGPRIEDLFRRNQFKTPQTPVAAVAELDWRRARGALLLGPLVSILALAFVLFVVDEEKMPAIGIWSMFGAIVLPVAYIVATNFQSNDQSNNGQFRWTLPVSDHQLARGGAVVILRYAAVIWGLWIIGFVCLIVASTFEGSSVPAADRAMKLSAGIAVAIPIACWIAMAMGTIYSLVGRCTDMLMIGAIATSPIIFAIIQSEVPESVRPIVAQAFFAAIGIGMIARTWRMFSYALRGGTISGEWTGRLLMIGIGVSLVASVVLICLHASWGLLILATGICSLIFHPIASLPMATWCVRHWYWPSNADEVSSEQ